jgi:hypothetical protein
VVADEELNDKVEEDKKGKSEIAPVEIYGRYIVNSSLHR